MLETDPSGFLIMRALSYFHTLPRECCARGGRKVGNFTREEEESGDEPILFNY